VYNLKCISVREQLPWPSRELLRPPAPAGLSEDEKITYDRVQSVYQKGIAYGFQLGLRPQTLYGIADSPVGLAAYFLDHDARSYELISRVFAGESEGLTRDDILDNVTIAWLTNPEFLVAVFIGRTGVNTVFSMSNASRFPLR
jgi:hypothetical protein